MFKAPTASGVHASTIASERERFAVLETLINTRTDGMGNFIGGVAHERNKAYMNEWRMALINFMAK